MRKAKKARSRKTTIWVIILCIILVIVGGFFLYQAKQFRDQKRYRRHMVKAYQEEEYEKALEYTKDIDRTHTIFSASVEEDVKYYEADSYVKLEKYDEAIELYDEMLSKNVEEAKLYMMKANCYMKQKQIKDALEVYKTGYDVTKDTSFLPNLAYCYIERGSYESAKKIVQEGIQSGDEKIQREMLFDEIILYEKETDYETAYEKAKEFVKLYPEDEEGERELIFLETRQE